QQWSDFYQAIEDDVRIGISHICLYTALLHECCLSAMQNPFYTRRSTITKKVRISRRTFSKCMNELQQYGYIKYEPSCNPEVGSRIYLNKL
ncbi:MAG: hypothetical protein ICV84_16750, partial [Flavisolibacter sp.]|nr:hypothetical protein [Flavisolibacter sp.]